MKTFGLEYAILPFIALPYFYFVASFSIPGALFNNCVLTVLCGLGAWWRSRSLSLWIRSKGGQASSGIFGKGVMDPLLPVWPALVALVLWFLAALQLILCITHISYYRDGQLVHDLFDA